MDTLERRLVADLTDAAEAAMTAGLTPPDRAAVEASVARRRRTRRLRVAVAAAAVTLVAAGAVAALVGSPSKDRTEMYPAGTGEPTTAPTTATTAAGDPGTTAADPSQTTTSTAPTVPEAPPGTPPDDPEQPGDVTNPLPVTSEEMQSVGANFADLPPTCRAYWVDGIGGTPEDQGLNRTQNLIEVQPATVTIADVNGDGVDDGVALYTCVTTGVMPPDGVVVVLAVQGARESERRALFDRNELSAEHQAQFGDPRARLSSAPTLATSGEGERLIEVPLASYREPDPNCCPSQRAVAQFAVAGDSLQLVNLNAS